MVLDLQTLLKEHNMTRSQLSKISGIPKTTVTDICTGRSSIERCSAKTVRQLAKAFGCSMEDIMELEAPSAYNRKAELLKNEKHLQRKYLRRERGK